MIYFTSPIIYYSGEHALTTTYNVTLTTTTAQMRFYSPAMAIISVNWGDGVTTQSPATASITMNHTYAALGDYTITVTSANNAVYYPNGSSASSTSYNPPAEVTGVLLDDGVVQLGNYSFSTMTNLHSITMMGDITRVGQSAFYNSSNLAEINMEHCSTVPLLDNANAFAGLPTDYVIYVPSAILNTWKQQSTWSSISSHIQSR